MKIEKLTREQELKLGLYKNEGIEVGLKMGPINTQKIVDLINLHLGLFGIAPVSKVTTYSSPMSAIAANSELSWNNAFYGQHDVSWLWFYKFFRDECGLVEETEKVKYLIELAKEAHWFWVSSDEIILSERPVKMCLKETGTMLKDDATGVNTPLRVLSSTDGMALEYADGNGVYALNGIRLPKSLHWVVKDWKTLTPKDILKIENAEIRQEAMLLYGPGIYTELPHKILDTFESAKGGFYELFEIDYGVVKRIYLKGKCPSKKDDFFEPVPPSATTCQQALNWREHGSLVGLYKEPIERT